MTLDAIVIRALCQTDRIGQVAVLSVMAPQTLLAKVGHFFRR